MNEIILFWIGLRPRANAIINRGEAGFYKIEMSWWLLKILNLFTIKGIESNQRAINVFRSYDQIAIHKSNKTFFLYSIIRND